MRNGFGACPPWSQNLLKSRVKKCGGNELALCGDAHLCPLLNSHFYVIETAALAQGLAIIENNMKNNISHDSIGSKRCFQLFQAQGLLLTNLYDYAMVLQKTT